MNAIGIVANPASGKDIRRLVAYATAMDNGDKVNIVRRIIMSLSRTNVDTVYYMKEYYGIIETALNGMYSQHKHVADHIRFLPVDTLTLGIELDTVLAVEAMRDLGVKCIITLGGDGTNRAVAKRCGDIPLIPISTGTNNVFPSMIEGTIAGMAAGAYAGGLLPENPDHLIPTKRLEILKNGEVMDIALIDAVTLHSTQIASRAVWKSDAFDQIFLTCCTGDCIGLSAVGGQLAEVAKEDPCGYYVECGPEGETLYAPMAPGLMEPVSVTASRTMAIGEEIPLRTVPCVIAVDGERDITVTEESQLSVRLTWNGPKLLNIRQVLRDARKARLFYAGPNDPQSSNDNL